MKILIAEDDFTSRAILTAALKKWGHDPAVTEDGIAAWEALQAPDPPRLILLDWNMPGMDGLEVCRRLREIPTSDPPYVILLTGRTEKGDIVKGLEAGANDYIAKPYDNEELQARIKVGQRMLELQTGLLEARDALTYQAMHDPLTGVFNRRAVLERLDAELRRARREETVLSVGMCDIDHFKQVNDTYGHQAGDEVLVGVTRCIRENLRSYDFVGRYGGEEFLIIATGLSDTGEDCMYERLRARIAATQIDTEAGTVAVTVSIGVATGTGTSKAERLLAAADAALYRAKEAGRNRVARCAMPSGDGS